MPSVGVHGPSLLGGARHAPRRSSVESRPWYFSLAARVLFDQGVLVVDRSHSRRDQGLAKAYFGLSLIRL